MILCCVLLRLALRQTSSSVGLCTCSRYERPSCPAPGWKDRATLLEEACRDNILLENFGFGEVTVIIRDDYILLKISKMYSENSKVLSNCILALDRIDSLHCVAQLFFLFCFTYL